MFGRGKKDTFTSVKTYSPTTNFIKMSLEELLHHLIDIAYAAGRNDIVHWAKLELNGYSSDNPECREDDQIPPYRTLSGQYVDVWGRPIAVDSQLLFMVEFKVSQSVPELTTLSTKDGMLTLEDPKRFELIRDSFGIQVGSFRFSPAGIQTVLSTIRTHAMDKIREIGAKRVETEEHSEVSGTPDTTNYLSLNGFHPRVVEVAGKLFDDGHYRQAILDTYIALVDQVKAKSGRYDIDGSALMQHVFSPKDSTILVSEDTDEQLGFMWLFSGAVMAIRNPKAHRLIPETDPQRTLEWLGFASALFKVLDNAQVRPKEN